MKPTQRKKKPQVEESPINKRPLLWPVSQQNLCFCFIVIPYPNKTNDFSTIKISKKKQKTKKKAEGNTVIAKAEVLKCNSS